MTKKQVTARQKQAVAQRAGNCCEYCKSQVRFAMQSFSVEHIVPLSKGGGNTMKNLALACQGCNNHKYNKTEALDPISYKIVSLYHPRQHIWQEHYVWNDDFTLIIGITSVGRATVEALQLNRENLVNLRQILYQAGEHPPVVGT